MHNNALHLRDFVLVDADFKPSVQLPFDFYNPAINERLTRSFIPTSQSIELFSEIARSLDPNSTERARSLVGTFGTGKSDLLLLICNYFARQADDPIMQPFYERLREISPIQAKSIQGRREDRPAYLVVLLQADTVSSFPGFVLHGLQAALDQIGMSHLMTRTRYAAAREQIFAWQHDQHARYADFCKLLQEHEQRDVNSLLAALSGAQADHALQIFLRTFKAVTGSGFHVYDYSQPHEAYAQVAEALVAAGTHSGILLVCDEFTAFLERFQSAIDQQLREIDSDTKAVENLAERSGSSGRAQLHFIVASLESFASAAGGIGSRSVAEATERSGGRFKHHSLLVQGSEELIRGAMKRLPEHDWRLLQPNTQRDDLLEAAEAIWKQQGRDREWIRKVTVEGAFPLHPITTYALPLINQRVAQSQRTMFLFLNDEAGLRGFIQREPLFDGETGWLRLLTPEFLFDYFRESIATKKSEVNDAYERAEQLLQTSTIEKTLASRVLKLIALCETLGSDLVLRPTRLFLRRALNLPRTAEQSLNHALTLLEELGAVDAPNEVESGTGIYRLPMSGRESVRGLRRRITARAQNLAAVGVEKLQALRGPESIAAGEYNLKRGSHRKLSAYYVGLTTLRSSQRLKQELESTHNRDALLWYVVTTSDAERTEAQSLARELTEQQDRLVVAVPVTPSSVLSALRDYQALTDLRHDPELEQANRPDLEDHGRVGREYKQRLDDELKKLNDQRQWEWFAAGRGATGLSKADVDRLVNQLVEKVFPDTPNTSLGQHFKPDDVGNTITKAVEQIIKGEIKLDTGAKSAVDNVLRTGAVSLGLLQKEQMSGSFQLYSLADPERGASLASGKVARKIREHLAAGKGWSNLVRDLRQPPFGLYDSLLILFLAAFMGRNTDSAAIQQVGVGRACDVDPALFKRMLERPQDYTIRFQPLSEAEKRWLRGLVERGLRQTDFTPPPGTTLRAAVATKVKTWLSRQQLPAFAFKLTEQQLAELLPEIDPATAGAICRLLECHSAEGDLAELLMTKLPLQLGSPEQHGAWMQASVDELLGNWITVCEFVAKLPTALKERTVARAAALFGAEQHSDPGVRWTTIYLWRQHHSAVQTNQLQHLALELFRLTSSVTGSIEQSLLDDFARRTVSVEYQRWQDLEKLERFFTELTKARDEIKRAWEAVALGDELWREGLARAVSGRTISGVSANQAAGHFAAWSRDIAWPACSDTLTVAQLQLIYPALSVEAGRDLAQLLSRSSYDEDRWRQDLQERLAHAFGVQSFSRAEVNAAVKRLETVIPLATSLESRLRNHVLERAARLFSISLDLPPETPRSTLMTQWQERYSVPEPNDLSAEAKVLLSQLAAASGDYETLLLTTLPRVLGKLGKPVRQWERYELLETYQEQLRLLIQEISSYEPVGPMLFSWLTGIHGALCQEALPDAPRERRRLIALIAGELSGWYRKQQLPMFAADLNLQALEALFPDAAAQAIIAAQLLLQRNLEAGMQVLISGELPAALGLAPQHAEHWDEQAVATALVQLAAAGQLIERLPNQLREGLLGEISKIFAASDKKTDARELPKVMREWRASYVILPDDVLSPNARMLYDSLGSVEDDTAGLLLQRLPSRIGEVKAPYENWRQMATRQRYLTILGAAAHEIMQQGKVGASGKAAETLWREFRERLSALSTEERRWMIKTFRDEFQQ